MLYSTLPEALRATKRRLGQSHAAIAAQIPAGRASWIRWYQGSHLPRRCHRPALASLIGITPEQLDELITSGTTAA